MDPDIASQPSEHDKDFIRLYKLLYDANKKFAYTAKNELNSSLHAENVRKYIKGLHEINEKISNELKKYTKMIAGIDETTDNIVNLEKPETYEMFISLLSPENQLKIPEFGISVRQFYNMYRMTNDLKNMVLGARLSGTKKSKHRRRKTKRKKIHRRSYRN
jgi:hypothetical protein